MSEHSQVPRVKIGVLYSTTGTYRVLGEDVCNGATLAVDEMNLLPSSGPQTAPARIRLAASRSRRARGDRG